MATPQTRLDMTVSSNKTRRALPPRWYHSTKRALDSGQWRTVGENLAWAERHTTSAHQLAQDDEYVVIRRAYCVNIRQDNKKGPAR